MNGVGRVLVLGLWMGGANVIVTRRYTGVENYLDPVCLDCFMLVMSMVNLEPHGRLRRIYWQSMIYALTDINS